jgi:hypothetical protein
MTALTGFGQIKKLELGRVDRFLAWTRIGHD